MEVAEEKTGAFLFSPFHGLSGGPAVSFCQTTRHETSSSGSSWGKNMSGWAPRLHPRATICNSNGWHGGGTVLSSSYLILDVIRSFPIAKCANEKLSFSRQHQARNHFNSKRMTIQSRWCRRRNFVCRCLRAIFLVFSVTELRDLSFTKEKMRRKETMMTATGGMKTFTTQTRSYRRPIAYHVTSASIRSNTNGWIWSAATGRRWWMTRRNSF